MNNLNILIVDDHQLLRHGIEIMIKSNFNKANISQANNGLEAYDLLKNEIFDVILLDINMPKLDGMALLRKLKNENNPQNIIMLSMHEDPKSISSSFEFGALCYLNKNSNSEEFNRAIGTVKNGEKYYTDAVAKIILGQKEKKEKKNSILSSLSKRENEIFNLIVLDYNNDNIAKKLNISVRTVEGHRKNIRNKLGLKTITSLVRFALDNNL